MKIVSLNMNGIRAAFRKGYADWLENQDADVICLQEVRIQEDQLTWAMTNPAGYQSEFCYAEKKGYSGVGIYYKQKPDRIQKGIGWDKMDSEARFIQMDWGNLSVISLYLPSGSSGEERQNVKYEVMDYFFDWMQAKKKEGREYIICGDWNIAHQKIDIKNWRGNQKNSGFLPEERAWLSKLFDEVGYVDVFRELTQEEERYTWWSNRGKAWENNTGWRIDYQIATPGIASLARSESIHREPRYSDHAPLIIDYEYTLESSSGET